MDIKTKWSASWQESSASACAACAFGATSVRDSALRASRNSALGASDSISNSLHSALRENYYYYNSNVALIVTDTLNSFLWHFRAKIMVNITNANQANNILCRTVKLFLRKKTMSNFSVKEASRVNLQTIDIRIKIFINYQCLRFYHIRVNILSRVPRMQSF